MYVSRFEHTSFRAGQWVKGNECDRIHFANEVLEATQFQPSNHAVENLLFRAAVTTKAMKDCYPATQFPGNARADF